MDKRVTFAIFLSFIIIFIFTMNAERPDPEKDGKPATDSTSPTDQGGDDGGEPQVDPVPGSGGVEPGVDTDPLPDTPPSGQRRATVSEPFAGELALMNETQRLVFSQRGAALETLYLRGFDAEVGGSDDSEGYENKLRVIRTYEGGTRALSIQDGDATTDDGLNWFDQQLWETAGPSDGGRELRFHLTITDGGTRYRLHKSFRLSEQAHRLEIRLGLELIDGAATSLSRFIWLQNSGGIFPPGRVRLTGSGTSRLARSITGEVSADGLETLAMSADDLLDEKEQMKAVPNTIFTCDMGVYFGAYLRWLEGGSTKGAQIFATNPAESDNIDELERVGPVRTYSRLGVNLSVDADRKLEEAVFDYYVGPKDHRNINESYASDDDLRAHYLEIADGELTSQSFCPCGAAGPLGWLIKVISKAVVWVISFFNSIFGSMGVSIIVLTICVRGLMFPITRKSQVAMHQHAAKMQKIKPRLDKLKEKYKDDRQKFAQEQMKLFKQEKMQLVPLGGCLPLFLQIPIFFGLFSAIRFDIDLRHSSFLWCKDLSMPDSVMEWEPWTASCCIAPISISGLNIFPLLMIAAMFFHQLGMPKSPDPQMQQQQKMMLFMPLFFGVLMYGYAAGLSVYWLSSSLFGIFEQRVIKKLFPIDKPNGDDSGAVAPAKS